MSKTRCINHTAGKISECSDEIRELIANARYEKINNHNPHISDKFDFYVNFESLKEGDTAHLKGLFDHFQPDGASPFYKLTAAAPSGNRPSHYTVRGNWDVLEKLFEALHIETEINIKETPQARVPASRSVLAGGGTSARDFIERGPGNNGSGDLPGRR